MATYTTTIRNYLMSRLQIDNPNEDIEHWNYKQVIEQGMKYLFDFDYPIFDESYRNVIQTKIIKNYYMREIAHETIGQFKMRLDNKLNIIMARYNQLYESERLEIQPLLDYNITETMARDKTDKGEIEDNLTGNIDTTSQDKSTSIYSKYPQTRLSGNTDYATDSTENSENGSTNSQTQNNSKNTRNLTSTDDYIKSLTGNRTSQSLLLKQYRDNILNIDEEVINALDDLFMVIW